MDWSVLLTEYRDVIFRVVESQETIATMNLVDTLDEQSLLEDLIEASKPSAQGMEQYHYLIKTPFSVEVYDPNHIDLSKILDSKIIAKLRHKSDYQVTQSIGKQMREKGISSFSFPSARCEEVNVGVFDIRAFTGEPRDYLSWEVNQTTKNILYYC